MNESLPDIHAILDAIIVILVNPVNVSDFANELHICSVQ